MTDLRAALLIARKKLAERKTSGSSGSTGSSSEIMSKHSCFDSYGPGTTTAALLVPVVPPCGPGTTGTTATGQLVPIQQPDILYKDQPPNVGRNHWNQWNHQKQTNPESFKIPIATPVGFSEKQWESIRTGAEAFAHQWAAQAYGLGWSEDELFGLHPIAPAARVERRGLAFLLHAGDRVVALDGCGADIVTASGARQRCSRGPKGRPSEIAREGGREARWTAK